MTLRQATPAPAPTADVRATLRRGGGLLVAAGVLQSVGAARIVVPALPEQVAPGWLLLGWLAGGIVLLVASIALAVGRRGEPGLVGPSRWRRAALVASSTGTLLLVAVFILSWSIGPAVWGLTSPVLSGVQLLILATTTVVAVTVVQRGEVTGAARWAFAGLAAVDAVALLLTLVPQTAVAFQVVVVGVRSLAVVVVGVLLVLDGRALRADA